MSPVFALMPDVWFTDRHTMVLVLIAIVAMTIVIRGADWLVEGAAGLAYRLGMSKVVIGATIVSLGTTSPEAAVSVLAAWQDNAGLALGNGVGSIIADTGLIFGIGCLWVALPADRFILKRQGVIWIGAAVMLAAICYGVYAYHGDATTLNPAGNEVPMARLGRSVGLLFLVLLVGYMMISVHWSRQHAQWLRDRHAEASHTTSNPGSASTTAPDQPSDAADANEAGSHDDQREEVLDPVLAEAEQFTEPKSVPTLLGLLLLGLSLVVFAGDALVQSASEVTVRWGVPQVVVSATLIAFGTSLPELIVGITSIRKKHPELLVGNVIGADILNVLFVIGAAAVAKPLAIIEPGTPAPAIFLYLHLPVMLMMLLLVGVGIIFAVRKGAFSRWLGPPLLLLYIGFAVAVFVLSAPSAH